MAVINEENRRKIIIWRGEGYSQRKIAKKLKVSLRGVQGVLSRYNDGFGIKNRPKPSKKKLLTKRDDRKLLITSKKFPKMTANQLKRECGFNDISVDTIKRSLRSSGQMGRVACKKPSLTSSQKSKRLKWCKNKIEWTSTEWSKIVFSDESKMELHGKTREYVRRQPGSNRYDEKYISRTTKFSPSLMVWGAIRSDGQRVLLRCDRNVDQHYYQSLLDEGLPQIYTTRYLFQQDGASCHTARSTRQYFVNKSIRLLPDWPSQSADISIIENLWKILKSNVKMRNPQNCEELWNVCKEEWQNIPNKTIKDLYESIPRRIQSVVHSRGANTKY